MLASGTLESSCGLGCSVTRFSPCLVWVFSFPVPHGGQLFDLLVVQGLTSAYSQFWAGSSVGECKLMSGFLSCA